MFFSHNDKVFSVEPCPDNVSTDRAVRDPAHYQLDSVRAFTIMLSGLCVCVRVCKGMCVGMRVCVCGGEKL